MSQQALTPELILIFMIFTSTFSTFYSLPVANSLTLELVRRDAIDFKLFPKNLSDEHKNLIFAELSHSRARRFVVQQSIISNSVNGSAATIDTIRPTIKQFLDSLFAVSMDIGSKPYHTYLVVDTASSQVWVQCKGCKDCFNIKHGAFNQRASTTYRKMRWDDPLCQPPIRVKDNCKFEVNYATGQIRGIKSLENIHFMSNEGPIVTVPNMVLGCANRAEGVTFGENDGHNNVISGILGLALGRGNYGNTFMDITKNLTKMKFSYCLPAWNASLSKRIPLTFGNDVPRIPHSAQTTPMKNSLFYLNVSDISVRGRRLNLDPKNFKIRRDTTGGFIIDSGCGMTYLVNSVYLRVKDALTGILNKFMKPVKLPHEFRYPFCYKWPMHTIKNPPSVTFHMQNANLEVRFSDLFVMAKAGTRTKLACLTILPTDDKLGTNILGSANQADYRFLYDLESQALSFHRVQC